MLLHITIILGFFMRLLTNISRPEQSPQEGDWVQYITDSGKIVEKQYHDLFPQDVLDAERLERKIEAERRWRNEELSRTDSLMILPDYPQKEALTVYRQELRDWPSTDQFPDTRPQLA